MSGADPSKVDKRKVRPNGFMSLVGRETERDRLVAEIDRITSAENMKPMGAITFLEAISYDIETRLDRLMEAPGEDEGE